MENIIKEFKRITTDLYGERITSDDKCVFCAGKLDKNEYCTCKDAEKINRYYRKSISIIGRIRSYLIQEQTKDETIIELKQSYKIPPCFQGMDFLSYKTTTKEQQQVLKAVQAYSKDAIKNYLNGTNLILLGNYGTGKTMLISILCDFLAENYLFKNKFINAVDLVTKIKNTFSESSTISALKLAEVYKKADFLFIDDIDKINPTDFVRELMYSIVNYRIENQLPLIISGNHTLEELDEKFFGEVVVSRIVQRGITVQFKGKNMRYE